MGLQVVNGRIMMLFYFTLQFKIEVRVIEVRFRRSLFY